MGRERIIDEHKGSLGELIECLFEGDNEFMSAVTRARVKFAVNDKIVSLDSLVEDGDEIAVLPPFSGG